MSNIYNFRFLLELTDKNSCKIKNIEGQIGLIKKNSKLKQVLEEIKKEKNGRQRRSSIHGEIGRTSGTI